MRAVSRSSASAAASIADEHHIGAFFLRIDRLLAERGEQLVGRDARRRRRIAAARFGGVAPAGAVFRIETDRPVVSAALPLPASPAVLHRAFRAAWRCDSPPARPGSATTSSLGTLGTPELRNAGPFHQAERIHDSASGSTTAGKTALTGDAECAADCRAVAGCRGCERPRLRWRPAAPPPARRAPVSPSKVAVPRHFAAESALRPSALPAHRRVQQRWTVRPPVSGSSAAALAPARRLRPAAPAARSPRSPAPPPIGSRSAESCAVCAAPWRYRRAHGGCARIVWPSSVSLTSGLAPDRGDHRRGRRRDRGAREGRSGSRKPAAAAQ